MKLTALLVGSGAREHAIAMALNRKGIEIVSLIDKKNPGIIQLSSETHFVNSFIDGRKKLRKISADLAIIGPELPLSLGYADILKEKGIPVLGPTSQAARIETSKIYARQLMETYKIDGLPTFHVCSTEYEIQSALKDLNYSVAIKPDGLTGGKGVKVTGDHLKTKDEILNYALSLVSKDGVVIVEEKITGLEFTAQSFSDGVRAEIMPLVRDYKRAYDEDKGPNTGSMGSINFQDHLLPYISRQDLKMVKKIMEKTVDAIKKDSGETYHGILYGQFMKTDDGPKLIEFNARFGDPEAMNVLALLETSLADITLQINDKNLKTPVFKSLATCVVYVVPEGYPEKPISGAPISVNPRKDAVIHYGSVNLEADGKLLTTSSRTLGILGFGNTVKEARERAYSSLSGIRGRIRWRSDIGSEFA